MMNYGRRNSFAAQRFAERRRREDESPRLSAQAPDLASLRLDVEERCGVAGNQPRHARHLVVDRAPALFLVPCGDPRCMDGGHDITASVMRSLRVRAPTFLVDDACSGAIGPSPCTRVLHVEGTASYRALPSAV